jgi:hypothetical protein
MVQISQEEMVNNQEYSVFKIYGTNKSGINSV